MSIHSTLPREALFEPLLFPEAEYRARVERAQRLLRGEPAWLVHRSAEAAVAEMSWVPEVRAYESVEGAPIDQLAKLLDRHRIVAAELGHEQRLDIAPRDLDRLRHAAPRLQLVDGADLLWRLRAVKSPAELTRLRRAATMTARAYKRAFGKIRPGMTEREAGAQLGQALVAEGAHASWHDVLTGDYGRPNGFARNRRLQEGEMLWADMGANYAGYWADFSRAGVLGGPTPEQEKVQNRIVQATKAGVAAIRPGQTMRQVAEALDRACQRLGVTMNRHPGRYGHGLGLAVTEPPHLARFDDTVVEPGMVLTVEPGMWTEDGMYHCEECVVVKPDGVEVLSDYPRELAVL